MKCEANSLWSTLALALVLTMSATALAQTVEESYAALDRGDYPTALAGFKGRAENGEANSQGVLAMMYAEGWGTPKNARQTFYWYHQSAEQGNWIAQYSLGQLYALGSGVPMDMPKSYFWWLLACNDATGKQKLAERCTIAESLIPLKDRAAVQAEARKWGVKTAERAREIAIAALGALPTSSDEASKVPTKNSGGEVVIRDKPLALAEREHKAEGGDAVAQMLLGLAYQNGELGFVDHGRAAFWFQKSAEQGNDMAQLLLGQQYDRGTGVPQDQQKAFHWYFKAAEQGLSLAQHEVGLRYTNGNGVAKDDHQAFGWFRKAAEQGEANAQTQVGLSYFLGRGVAQDYQQAMLWSRKAADQSNAMGQLSLGEAYASGRGVPKDDQQAVFWIKKAATQGNAYAQYRLGAFYGAGTGVTKDVQQAYFWWLLSVARGYAEAAKIRDTAERLLTVEQRNAAQAAARDWKPTTAAQSNSTASTDSDNGSSLKPAPNQPTVAKPDSSGSGFRVARGAIVTNHHVIDGCSRLSVNGVAAQVRGNDARSDLALLNSTVPGPSTNLRARRVAVGEPVAVAGYPLRGLLSGFNMTTGTLSSLSGMGGDTRLVQITAPVQPGNSGGPVLDSAANLMGVVVSKLDAIKAAKITGDIPQNVNFAINVNVLRSFLDANSVEYDTANSDKALPTTAIAEKAKGFTVLVECWK